MSKIKTTIVLLAFLISNALAARRPSSATRRVRKPKTDTIKSSTDPGYIKEDSLRFEIISNADFDKQMENFNLEVIHNIAVSPKDRVEYNFDLTAGNGDFIWITYLIKDEADFEFGIIDRENNSVLYSSDTSRDFMGKLYFERSEKLQVYFLNRSYGSYVRMMVGFECHDCNESKKLADKTNVQKTLGTLKHIDSIKSRMYFVNEMYKERQKTFLKKMKSSHQNIFYFTIAEIVMVVVINVYQVCSIKNLMSKRIMV